MTLSLTVFALEYVIQYTVGILLSKQVDYNQVVVKCQILQDAFFKILICKNFKIWNIQIQGLFKDFQGPTLFSRTFKGLEFFSQIQGLSRTSQGPYEL